MLTQKTRKSSRLAVFGALTAVLVLALASCGSDTADETSDASMSSDVAESPTAAGALELTVAPPPGEARCMAPNADVLATQDTAFEGTVTDVSEGQATLSVDHWYSGGAGTDAVSVSTPSKKMQDLLVAVSFEEGTSYLVSSLDGRVSLCGFTAETTPELEELYETAFAH